MSDLNERFPHCDNRVIHEPKSCDICDTYAPKRQQERIAAGINFTGQTKPGLKPCPADAARGVGGAHVWYGNAPKPKANAVCIKCGGPGFKMFSEIECLSMFCISPELLAKLDGRMPVEE